MKLTVCLSSLFVFVASGAMAIDLNTDALKTMQQQGQEIVAQAQQAQWRSFALDGDMCLQMAGTPDKVGASMVVRKCNASAKNQQFSFDDQGRLATQGGVCVGVAGDASKPGANALTQACGGQAFQKWRIDEAGRLHNNANKCLLAVGKPGEPTGNVVSSNCNASPNQVWK
ncbi:ricin-type beta-trefoil lectin domain protein [Haliea sp. E17]|uniref:ricin-type beta-trefoil lectin domain protein n=1 Tax=Haliea sp. E17 TaxID=3401576 RepID=UPI003AAB7B9F